MAHDMVEPVFIGDGYEIDFSDVAIGSSKVIPVLFGLGETGRDESLDVAEGPNFNFLSGSANAFFLESVSCETVGIGFDCRADAIFRPTSLGDSLARYSLSAFFVFTEIHGEDTGEVFEYGDSFQVSFRGTGVAAVPLPPAAAASLAALGMLGWIGRRQRRS